MKFFAISKQSLHLLNFQPDESFGKNGYYNKNVQKSNSSKKMCTKQQCQKSCEFHRKKRIATLSRISETTLKKID